MFSRFQENIIIKQDNNNQNTNQNIWSPFLTTDVTGKEYEIMRQKIKIKTETPQEQ